MISIDEIQPLLDSDGTVVDNDGDKIGKVSQVFLDDQTGNPEWVTVTTGMFGTAESFIPLGQASISGDTVRVPYDKAKVKGAPQVEDSSAHLSESEEGELYRYYGLDTATGYDTSEYAGTSGPTTDDAMTRSEERLHVGTEQVQSGRARLRKHVVTEQQTVTVPVSHEEVRLEREPITADDVADATAGPAISEDEHEVVLTEERAVVSKETVPVERVQVGTETVTENQTVTDSVRKEEIELDTSGEDRDATTV